MRTMSLLATALCSALFITGCDPAQQITEQTDSAIEPYNVGYGFIRLKAANGFYVRANGEGQLVADSTAPETFAMHLVYQVDAKTAQIALETNDGLFLRTPGGGGLDLFVSQHTPGGGGVDLFTGGTAKTGGGGVDLFTGGTAKTGGGGVDLFTGGTAKTGGGGVDLFTGGGGVDLFTGGGGVDLFTGSEFAREEIFTLRELKPGYFTLQANSTGGVVGLQGGGGLDLLVLGDSRYSETDLFQVSFAAEPCCNQ